VEPLVNNQDDVLSFLGGEVFGSPLDKILISAVLTSAAASTQTTILPTAPTTLSMARAKALPRALGHVSTRYLTPTTSTVLMGLFSVLWYVGLTIVSENILFDSISALGLMIALLPADRLRLRRLLPPRALPQPEDVRPRRPPAAAWRADHYRRVHQVVCRPLRP
jgi:amino acid transporter